MIFPDKIIMPVNSLVSIGAEVIKILEHRCLPVEELYSVVVEKYPVDIPFDNFLLCLDFLYMIGKVEGFDEIRKA